MFLWYTETVSSWYIQSLVPKCAYFISLSNGNTFRPFTIPKTKRYLWGSKSVFVIILTLLLLIKVEKKKFVCIYCTEQLNLKNISYWHYFTTKIMSICLIWNFTLYVTQTLHFFEHWLLTEAKPRSIVRVEGTTNVLFPNTVYKYFIMPKKFRLIVEWSPQNDKNQ